ncbi:hypothetical protein GBO14_04630 [Pseudoalteromonas shioyasakiensis]|uniref:hypothetical protein n=1 Tax=Pseudoalteromonas TaxID=53246 RepID=UPI00203DE239|nr:MULTISPECIES: hypothetical protein [Pseudoalteromonas]MCO6354037.1 hypothetical protein [Pseudoalteromonas shioyasakiensis]GKW53639.1 hypothetical protein NCCP2140_26920 [Pseudoalteromonas sp. NCCP-2140]
MMRKLSILVGVLALSGCTSSGKLIHDDITYSGEENLSEMFSKVVKAHDEEIKTYAGSAEYGDVSWASFKRKVASSGNNVRIGYNMDTAFKRSCSGEVKAFSEGSEFTDLAHEFPSVREQMGLSHKEYKALIEYSAFVGGLEGLTSNSIGSDKYIRIESPRHTKSYFCLVDGDIESAVYFGSAVLQQGDEYERHSIIVYFDDKQIVTYMKDLGGSYEKKLPYLLEAYERKQLEQKQKEDAERKKYAHFRKTMKEFEGHWRDRHTHSYLPGDSVCSYNGNYSGHVEVINDRNMKVTWNKQFNLFEDGFFYGNFPYRHYQDDYSFNFSYRRVSIAQWVTKNDVAKCTINVSAL